MSYVSSGQRTSLVLLPSTATMKPSVSGIQQYIAYPSEVLKKGEDVRKHTLTWSVRVLEKVMQPNKLLFRPVKGKINRSLSRSVIRVTGLPAVNQP
jgi:hypothetical protein